MAIIQFANGKKVNFDGNPTPEDVDYVAKQLGITADTKAPTPYPAGTGAPPTQDQLSTAKGQVTGALPTLGAIAGGIGGGALGGLVASPSILGIPAGVMAGGAAGAGLGGAAGEAAKEKLRGGTMSPSGITKTGAGFAALDLVGGPIAKAGYEAVVPTAAKTASKLLEMVSPRLTASQAEKTAVTAPSKIMGKISPVASKYTEKVAKAVEGIVNPKKSFSEGATAAENAAYKEADKLMADLKATGRTYTPQELNKALKQIEIPQYIKTSEKVVKKDAATIINKFRELGAKNKGTLDGLLKTRREFDQWVKKTYPKVFDRQGIAINDLVKNVRTAGNDFLARMAGGDVAVKDALEHQSLLFEASDVLSEKAAFGAPSSMGEIGTNRFQRFAANNPTKTKVAKNLGITALAGLGGTGLLEGAKKLGL